MGIVGATFTTVITFDNGPLGTPTDRSSGTKDYFATISHTTNWSEAKFEDSNGDFEFQNSDPNSEVMERIRPGDYFATLNLAFMREGARGELTTPVDTVTGPLGEDNRLDIADFELEEGGFRYYNGDGAYFDYYFTNLRGVASNVPEPTSALIWLLGSVSVGVWCFRRR